jgi:hypothetical protein
MNLIKAPFCFLSLIFITFSLQGKCETYKLKQADTTGPSYDEVLTFLEKQAANKHTDSLGVLLETISLEVKTKDTADFEDGIMEWIDIAELHKELPQLVDKDKVVIPQNKVTVIIDYPLTNEYRFTLVSDTGFSRKCLVKEITKVYYKLYRKEKNTAKTKAIPKGKREGTYNRNETDGKYGIWGHDIEDLALANILVYQSRDGEIILSLDMDS